MFFFKKAFSDYYLIGTDTHTHTHTHTHTYTLTHPTHTHVRVTIDRNILAAAEYGTYIIVVDSFFCSKIINNNLISIYLNMNRLILNISLYK